MEMKLKTSGLHHLMLTVSDLARAREFYTGLLGFPVVFETPDYFICRIGKTSVAFRAYPPPQEGKETIAVHHEHLAYIAIAAYDEVEFHRIAGGFSIAGIPNSGIQTNPHTGEQYVDFNDPEGIRWRWIYAP